MPRSAGVRGEAVTGRLDARDDGRGNGRGCRDVLSTTRMAPTMEPTKPTERVFGATSALTLAAAILLTFTGAASALTEREFYIEDIPQGLSSGESDRAPRGPSLAALVKGPNGKEVEKCASKCIVTCTRGGSGAPGLGPLSVRKAPVVFKEGFRRYQV